MGSFSEDDDYRFFDAYEDISSASGVYTDSIDSIEASDADCVASGWDSSSVVYDVWRRCPGSVKERRNEFLSWMGADSSHIVSEDEEDVCGELGRVEMERIMENGGAVLRMDFEEEFRSSRSSISSWLSNETEWSRELAVKEENFVSRDGNSNEAMECRVSDRDGELYERRESGSNCGTSMSFQHLMESVDAQEQNSVKAMKGNKKGWFTRLRSLACVVDRQGQAGPKDHEIFEGPRVQKVKVRHSNKRSKELSALYMGQEFQAHSGAILKMKFSPDGQFLASAGEDGIVRLWQVVEDERSNERDIPEIDPSCVYFTANQLSELTPLFADKEKMGKPRSLRKTSDSACVIFPPKVFRLLETPLHEFHGHNGEILDLAWSNNNCLLSSSVDKTVRLWKAGCNDCLGVFKHSNFVTSVQFNPVDDDYFISGSIDGKVRIWAISGCQVVDWTDIREIVTAVCYHPDGKGAIVGCMSGICRFYNVSDNHLQLDAQTCLCSKKKSALRRITGIEFFSQDSSRVMVTCADSQIRILDGVNVISRYKGARGGGSQSFASFTSNGSHIILASEDSNVYMWNCVNHYEQSDAKVIRSCERFSANASVAIPWCGLKESNSGNEWPIGLLGKDSPQTLPYSPAYFSLGQEYFLETFPKGSATWPEETLPSSSKLALSPALHKTQYEFFKNSCQSTSSSHAWGLVIVTAGWDGKIRSFVNYGLPASI